MNIRTTLRKPITWIVAAELGLVAAAGFAAWHVWVAHHPQAPAAATGLPVPAPGAAGAVPPGPQPRPSGAPTPLAAARTAAPAAARADPSFLAGELGRFNRDQAGLEDREWRLLKQLSLAVRSYVDRVVIPAVDHAQAGH